MWRWSLPGLAGKLDEAGDYDYGSDRIGEDLKNEDEDIT